jgi:hypothetical protein
MNIGSLFEVQVARDERSRQLSRVLCIKAEKFGRQSHTPPGPARWIPALSTLPQIGEKGCDRFTALGPRRSERRQGHIVTHHAAAEPMKKS